MVHRRNVDGNTAAESCYIYLEGLEIREEVVTQRCEYPYLFGQIRFRDLPLSELSNVGWPFK